VPAGSDEGDQRSPERVTLGEMITLADADLDDAVSTKTARPKWGRPNNAEEDRAITVRRAILTTLQLFAQNEDRVRAALRPARSG
jgi:hypothetical protein